MLLRHVFAANKMLFKNPEESGGKGGGSRDQDGEHM